MPLVRWAETSPTGSAGTVRLTSGRAFHIPHELAEKVLGWKPQVGMREEIRRLLAWREAQESGA
jgi:UDP-glucose 4-epimerase